MSMSMFTSILFTIITNPVYERQITTFDEIVSEEFRLAADKEMKTYLIDTDLVILFLMILSMRRSWFHWILSNHSVDEWTNWNIHQLRIDCRMFGWIGKIGYQNCRGHITTSHSHVEYLLFAKVEGDSHQFCCAEVARASCGSREMEWFDSTAVGRRIHGEMGSWCNHHIDEWWSNGFGWKCECNGFSSVLSDTFWWRPNIGTNCIRFRAHCPLQAETSELSSLLEGGRYGDWWKTSFLEFQSAQIAYSESCSVQSEDTNLLRLSVDGLNRFIHLDERRTLIHI